MKTIPAVALLLPVLLTGGGAEMIYEFRRDGTYRFGGVIVQERPSGTFSFQVNHAGTFRATTTRITLHPERGTKIMHDPDSPGGDTKRPVSTAAQNLRWQVAGEDLVLTEQSGIAVTYRRQ